MSFESFIHWICFITHQDTYDTKAKNIYIYIYFKTSKGCNKRKKG